MAPFKTEPMTMMNSKTALLCVICLLLGGIAGYALRTVTAPDPLVSELEKQKRFLKNFEAPKGYGPMKD